MKLITIFLSAFMLLSSVAAIADATQDFKQLQKRWAEVNYTLKDKAQQEVFEELVIQADKATESHPDSAEVLIWSGIIKSSFAGAKGGLGALSLAKASKADLEKAITINDTALAGSAYTSLGTLYFKVPGWLLGFGKDKKAKELLEKALTINPDGIDSNYFYAEFLADQRLYDEAEKYLLKAQQAPARPDRPLADKGRHDDINSSLQNVRTKLASKK